MKFVFWKSLVKFVKFEAIRHNLLFQFLFPYFFLSRIKSGQIPCNPKGFIPLQNQNQILFTKILKKTKTNSKKHEFPEKPREKFHFSTKEPTKTLYILARPKGAAKRAEGDRSPNDPEEGGTRGPQKGSPEAEDSNQASRPRTECPRGRAAQETHRRSPNNRRQVPGKAGSSQHGDSGEAALPILHGKWQGFQLLCGG